MNDKLAEFKFKPTTDLILGCEKEPNPVVAFRQAVLRNLMVTFKFDSDEVRVVRDDPVFIQSAEHAYAEVADSFLRKRRVPGEVEVRYQPPGTRDRRGKELGQRTPE